LFVSDVGTNNIKILNLDGGYCKTFGAKGRGPSDTYFPIKICLVKDRLVVWEMGNRRFSFFSLDGKFLQMVKPDFHKRAVVRSMKTLDDRRIVLEILETKIDIEKNDAFEWRMLRLYSSEMKFIKELYRQKERGYKYFKEGKHFMITIPYSPQLCWDVLGKGKIVLGFSDKYEIKILDIDKNTTKSFSHPYTPVPVKKLDKEKALDSLTSKFTNPRWLERKKFILANTPFPAYKPVFKKIVCDIEGNILVFTNSKSDEGTFRKVNSGFDAFDNQGNLINNVRIQNNNFSILIEYSLSKNEFWVFNNDDEINFIKYKAR